MLNQRILEALRKIRDDGPPHLDDGLCCNVISVMASSPAGFSDVAIMSRLETMFRFWPPRAEPAHPVGGVDEYISCLETGTFWNNPRRHQLLHWMIMFLENEVCPQ